MATIILMVGVALAISAVDEVLSYAGIEIAGGAAFALAHTTYQQQGGRSEDLRGGDGEAWRFALLSYGLVADEWENLRDIAPLTPEKRSGDTEVIQRPADEARTALP